MIAKDQTKPILPEGEVLTIGKLKDTLRELMNRTWVYDGREFNLADRGWRYDLSKAKTSLGLCSSRKKTIFISEWLFSQNKEKAAKWEDTIRHEIAHAIDFEHRGESDHSEAWKKICVAVGANPHRVNKTPLKKKFKYTATCDCGQVYNRHRKPSPERKPACGRCCKKYNGGKYTEDFLLKYKQNY